jgi:hypothetical protein
MTMMMMMMISLENVTMLMTKVSGHVIGVVARCTSSLTGVTHDVTTAVRDRS